VSGTVYGIEGLKHLENTRSPKNWSGIATNPSYNRPNIKEVQLIWMPGHDGFAGNETADLLARTGSEHPFTGLEPACGISIGDTKKAVRDWTNRNHTKPHKTMGIHNWTQTGRGTHIKTLCQKNKGSVKIKQRPLDV
jgi:hypothetical protein